MTFEIILIKVKLQVNMATSITTISPVILSSPTSGSNQATNVDGYDTVMKIFCFISMGSVVPNVLFLIAMLLNYSRMRGGNHNILLYNMMISDTLAGNIYFQCLLFIY